MSQELLKPKTEVFNVSRQTEEQNGVCYMPLHLFNREEERLRVILLTLFVLSRIIHPYNHPSVNERSRETETFFHAAVFQTLLSL